MFDVVFCLSCNEQSLIIIVYVWCFMCALQTWEVNQLSPTNGSRDIDFFAFRGFFYLKMGKFRGFRQEISQRHSDFRIPHTRISLNQLRKPLDLEMYTKPLRDPRVLCKRLIETKGFYRIKT